jgi:uncharacterized membrane protein YfcA
VLAFSLIPSGIDNVALFLIVGGLAVLLVSMAKAGFGGGVGLLSVPMMIIACGDQTQLATGIMLPILIVNDYTAIPAWWGKWSWRPVLLMLPGMAIGTAAGWLILWSFQQLGDGDRVAGQNTANAALMLGVGVIALGFVVLQIIRRRRPEPIPFRPVLWQGTCVGTAAGLTSTMAHAAGPIATIYLLPQRLAKDQFVATTLLYFWIGNQIKLIPYFFLGLLSLDAMRGALTFAPGVILGTLLGVVLNRKVGHREFMGIVYVLLALTGVHLIYGAVTKLWL